MPISIILEIDDIKCPLILYLFIFSTAWIGSHLKIWRSVISTSGWSCRCRRILFKKKILELYVNQIYFGSGAYGVEAAAKSYFEKKAIDLKIAEAAFLAGLIRAPSKYSPFRNPDLAQKRCRIVLKRLREEKFITREQHHSALQFPFEFQCWLLCFQL